MMVQKRGMTDGSAQTLYVDVCKKKVNQTREVREGTWPTLSSKFNVDMT